MFTEAMEEFVIDCRIRKLSVRTIKNYKMMLSIIRRDLEQKGVTRLEDVRSGHLKAFLLSKEDAGCKAQYLNDLLKVIRVFFRFAITEEFIKTDPVAHIHNVRQPKVKIRTFSEAEIRRMLGYFDGNSFLDCRNRTMLALFFDTGMRLAEVLKMTADQIHDGFILVHGKGSKERLVPVSPYLARQLTRYQRFRDRYFAGKLPPEEWFFVSRKGRLLTQEAVSKFMKEAAEAVHVSPDVRVSPHTCRHTFAHLQLKNGLDLYSLSRLMGHENIAITQRYLDGIRDDEVLEKAKGTGVLAHL